MRIKFPRKKIIIIIKNKSVVKQWPFKALGIFNKTNCMRKYFLVNGVLIPLYLSEILILFYGMFLIIL